jgi:HJR/Mrr/RecB family endonuclease
MMSAEQWWWKSLDGAKFEQEVALLWEGRGYKVQRTGRSGDEGVDIVLTRDGAKIIVQCKAQRNHVPQRWSETFTGVCFTTVPTRPG